MTQAFEDLSGVKTIIADLTQPLRELLHKEVEWHWSERQEKTFQAIKEKLTSDATSSIMMSKSPLQFQ